MTVTEQVDALRAMAISPIRRLVVPAGPRDGHHDAGPDGDRRPPRHPGRPAHRRRRAQHDASGLPHEHLAAAPISDIFSGLGKTVFFGLEIAAIGCYNGLQVQGGAASVGQATTRTVVLASICVLISDFFLTKLFLAHLMSAARTGSGLRPTVRHAPAPTAGRDDRRVPTNVWKTLLGPRRPGRRQSQDPPGRSALRARAVGNRQERHPPPHQRPDAAGRRRRARVRRVDRRPLRGGALPGAAPGRHALPGRRAVRLDERRAERGAFPSRSTRTRRPRRSPRSSPRS